MRKYRKIKYCLLIMLFLSLYVTTTVFAHPGGTESNGGHYDRTTGKYHYHHGYPAHQHTNGTCPYDFKDNVDHSSSGSATTPITWDNFFGFDLGYLSLLLVPSIAVLLITFTRKRVTSISSVTTISLIIFSVTFLLTAPYSSRSYHFVWIVLIPLCSFLLLCSQYNSNLKEDFNSEIYKKDKIIQNLNDIIKDRDNKIEKLENELILTNRSLQLLKNQIHNKSIDEFVKKYRPMEILTPHKIKNDFIPEDYPHFIFRINDNSMYPYICDNDLVIIETDYTPNPGDIILLCKENDKIMCRKLILRNGCYKLFNFNDPYLFFSFTESAFNRDQIWVIGKVVGVSNTNYTG